jgi:DNA processing protein
VNTAAWDWLALVRTPGLGPVGCGRLLERFGNPGTLLAASAADLGAAGLEPAAVAWLRQPDPQLLDRDLAWLAQPDHHLITREDPAYPNLLTRIAGPPPVLFVTGDPALLSQPQLAIVGSRNPTGGGRATARDFARVLAEAGLTITSGLAFGIDAAAHQGALERGRTLAVGATGPDRLYPAQHRELAERIAARGALVTEFPPGTGVRREFFPRRNRIISGLSLGTLVVEAALRSGSLITARLAAEQGREVFAVPGSIHNPQARGCHALIREGAKLVETAADVVEELSTLLGGLAADSVAPPLPAPGTGPDLDAEYQALLQCMGYDPVAPDALVRCSGLGADVVSSMLLLLELEGYVATVPGGRYCRTLRTPGGHTP